MARTDLGSTDCCCVLPWDSGMVYMCKTKRMSLIKKQFKKKKEIKEATVDHDCDWMQVRRTVLCWNIVCRR